MSLTDKEFWTALHGLILGSGFLLAFTGGFAGLWSLRPEWITPEGGQVTVRRTIVGTWAMAALAWATVLIGAYVIYPWYRAVPPANASSLTLQAYARSHLLSNPSTAGWHQFGMEWKEHVAWFAPILATAVAFVVTRQRRELIRDTRLRQMLLILFSLSFACAAIAGLLGAFINKAGPIR